MEIKLEYISKEKAQDLVETAHAKPIDPTKTKVYTAIMNEGEWVNADQHHLFSKKHYAVPLIFTKDGRLWEGKHRIFALAESEAKGFKFVCVHGWDEKRATEEYQTGEMKYWRWGFLVNAMYKLAINGFETTQL